MVGIDPLDDPHFRAGESMAPSPAATSMGPSGAGLACVPEEDLPPATRTAVFDLVADQE